MLQKNKYLPSMADLARETGVSIATVSRVLKGDSRISKATMLKVSEAAERLGYTQNLLVNGIRGAGTRTVGVAMGVSDFYVDVFRGIEAELWRRGCLPLVMSPSKGGPNEREILKAFMERRVEGVLVRPSVYAEIVECLNELKDRGLPLVLVDTRIPGVELPFSGTDDVEGGRLAAEYLLSQGHRVVGHIPGYRLHSATEGRRKGFAERLAQEPGAVLKAIPADESALPKELSVLSLLLDSPRPTAVFAFNDHGAELVYDCASKAGLRIPDDLSVLGFGDIPLGQLLRPKLSSFRQSPELIGANAVELLFEAVDGAAPSSKLAKPELIIRESVKCL